jgi:xylulokinase
MHGLVCVDKDQNLLYNSIIWCDSGAVSIGNDAFHALGADYLLIAFIKFSWKFHSL